MSRWMIGPDARGQSLGPDHGCHVFTPILREAGPSTAPRGIINVASAAAFGAAPGMAAYNVSKAGVLSLSETLAAELSGTGIKVTVLCPTFVKTNIVESGLQAGRISEESSALATKLMRWTGFSAEKVARICLDANDRGDLYCMPQLEAKIGWNVKRLAPGAYTRAVGLISRVGRTETPVHLKGKADGHRHGSHARQDQGSPVGTRRHRLEGAGGRNDPARVRPKLKAFMADLCWIENIGARGFAALARRRLPRLSPRSTGTSMPRNNGTRTPNWR